MLPKPHPASHYNMTFEEEEKFLAQFSEKAEKGQIIEVSEIKQAYVEKVGHSYQLGTNLSCAETARLAQNNAKKQASEKGGR